MAVPAFLMIAIEQSVGAGHASSARLALLGALGATVGLGLRKLTRSARHST
jgi:hypothetical protein